MINSKKLLSLFLAVVMILSTFTVMAFAYTVGPEKAGDINYKYTVEKVDTVPETEAGSAEYTADNIYAVTIWMSSNLGVDCVTTPVHYNKAHFSPIVLFDGESTYPQGAGKTVDMEGMTQDNYYEYMGEGNLYAYSLGEYMNNTGMYKANGTTATTKALAKCIGLGNKNSDGVTVTAELVSPDHPLYNKWGAGLPANTGVMYVNLDVVAGTKTAYLNTLSGVKFTTDWVNVFTVYFETLDGVTDADVAGDEFGVYTDDCFTVDGTTDDNGLGYYDAATSITGNPNKNVVSNAVVEAAATPELELAALKQQIRFPANKETFDYRIFANITNLEEIFGDVAGVNDKSDNTYMTEAGFIFNLGAIDQDAALTQINGGEVTYGEVNPETGRNPNHQKNAYISTSTGLADYAMACVIYDIPYDAANETVSVLAYVKYVQDGEAKVALVDAYTGTFEPLFSTHKPA